MYKVCLTASNFRCRRVGTTQSLNSTKYLASEEIEADKQPLQGYFFLLHLQYRLRRTKPLDKPSKSFKKIIIREFASVVNHLYCTDQMYARWLYMIKKKLPSKYCKQMSFLQAQSLHLSSFVSIF